MAQDTDLRGWVVGKVGTTIVRFAIDEALLSTVRFNKSWKRMTPDKHAAYFDTEESPK